MVLVLRKVRHREQREKSQTVYIGRHLGIQLPWIFYEALFVCFLLSIYTEVPLFLTGTVFVPSFVTLMFIVPILALLFCNTMYKYVVEFIGLVFAVLLLTALASPGFEHIGEKLLGLLQTMASIVAGLLLFKLIGRLNKARVARILLVLSIILVVGAALEVTGVLRGASDAFRSVAYAEGGYEVYDSATRDAGITGFARPNLFTSEPSLLAKGFFVFVNSWLLLAYTRRNYFLASSLTLLMFLLNGSPTLILSLMASAAVAVYSEKWFRGIVPVVLLLLLSSLATLYVSPDVFINTFARFDNVRAISLSDASSLANDSIGLRLILPFIVLVDVIRNSPFFGVGISGKEVIETYSSVPLSSSTALGGGDASTSINNNVATLFIYMGVIGSLLFAATFLRYFRKVRLREVSLLLIMVMVLALSMGAFEGPRFWGYVFLFIGVMKMRNEIHLEEITTGNSNHKMLEERNRKIARGRFKVVKRFGRLSR